MKDNTIRFSILLFLYYCRYCVLYSFASVFFEEQGFSAVQIGQLAAISGFVVIFAGPLMGMLADRAGGEKKVVLSCLIMTLFLTAGVYAARKVFWPLLLLYGTVAFFDKAVSPLMDSWIVRSKRGKEALPYGKIRAVGSLGGALCAVGTGALIDAAGFGAVFLLHMGMTALLILGTVRVKDGIKEREKKKTDEAISAGGGADMAQNGGGTLPVFYGILLAVTILLFTGVTAEVTYYPILFQECGGRKAWLGAAMFLMSASELTGMACYPRLRLHVPLRWALFASLAVYTGKLLLEFFAAGISSIPSLMLLQLLQGGAYGTLLPAVTEMVPSLVEKRRTATALSACYAGMQGAGVVLGNWIAGAICETSGIRPAFLAGSGFCALAATLYAAVFLVGKKGQLTPSQKPSPHP